MTADKRVGCLAEGEGGGRWGPAVGGGPGAGSVSPARVPPPPPSCPARPRVRGLDAGSRERAPQPSVCPCLTPSDGGREGSVALLAGRCHTGPLCRAVGGWPSAAVCGRTPQQGVGILPSSQESHICRFFVFGKVSFWKRPVSPQSHRGWQCRCGSWGRLGAPVTAPQRCRRRLGFHEQFVSGRRRGSPPPPGSQQPRVTGALSLEGRWLEEPRADGGTAEQAPGLGGGAGANGVNVGERRETFRAQELLAALASAPGPSRRPCDSLSRAQHCDRLLIAPVTQA